MKFKILFISILSLLFSCIEKKKVKTEVIKNLPAKNYFYVTANRLSLREKPSLNSKRVTVLKYLEPIEVIKNLTSKKEIIEDEEDGTINGNWCKVKLLNDTEGYVFNGYIKPLLELTKNLNPKGIEKNEILINGKLKITTKLSKFLKVMGKPDSIKSYKLVKNNFLNETHKEYKNGTLHIIQNTGYEDLEYGQGGWIYDDIKMKYFYKNGIEYEELKEDVSFSSIDFKCNNNFIEYNGFKIDSSTTLKTIAQLFPIQSMNKGKHNKNKKSELYEFGLIREKNNGSEIYWHLGCSTKATNFYVYWYD